MNEKKMFERPNMATAHYMHQENKIEKRKYLLTLYRLDNLSREHLEAQSLLPQDAILGTYNTDKPIYDYFHILIQESATRIKSFKARSSIFLTASVCLLSCNKQNQPQPAALGRCLGKKMKLFQWELERGVFLCFERKKSTEPMWLCNQPVQH